MKHTFKELHLETAAVPAGAELWGAIVAQKHPAGGAGTYPAGMTIVWKNEEGETNACRIVLCCNSHDGLVEALRGTDGTPNVPMVLAQALQGRNDVVISMLKELCSINAKALKAAEGEKVDETQKS